MSLAALNADDGTLLRTTCGAQRYVDAMLAARPFTSAAGVHAAATAAFATFREADLAEAMSRHPRIGDLKAASKTDAAEQAGAASADDAIKAALAQGNRDYEARFGHIYLVCATGKSGSEMLELLHARLQNDPGTELATAAVEQEKITHLRLDKILEMK